MVPAPITAMVWTFIRLSLFELLRSCGRQLAVLFIHKTQGNLLAMDEDGPPDQVWICSHELDGLEACWRILFHVFRAIQFVASVQKFLVVAFTDELVQFFFAEAFLVQIARSEIHFFVEQETSCFAAGRSTRFLQKLDFRQSNLPLPLMP